MNEKKACVTATAQLAPLAKMATVLVDVLLCVYVKFKATMSHMLLLMKKHLRSARLVCTGTFELQIH